MSGGELNYAYNYFEEAAAAFDDKEMRQLTSDLADVVHDLEWLLSGDISEEMYLQTLWQFKENWLSPKRIETRKQAIRAMKQIREFCGKQRYCEECPWVTDNGCFVNMDRCHCIEEMEIKDE